MADEKTEAVKIKHLRTLMDSLGMSIVDFSKYMKIRPRTAYRYLSGDVKIPHSVLLAMTLTLPKD